VKAALHLTPGTCAAERAARAAARRILAASLAAAALLAATAALVAFRGAELSSANRALSARIAGEARGIAAVEGDPRWAETKGRSLRVALPIHASGPRATDALFLLESSLPPYVFLNSLSFSRSGSSLLLDGGSERYEGGDVLRAALSAPSTGWEFRLEGSGYDQSGKVYTFRLAGNRRKP
jgi:hypothetical protein